MKKLRLAGFTALAMVLGVLSGLLFPYETVKLGAYSKYLISVFRWIAIPLLFFAILETFLKLEIHLRGVWYLLLVTTTNLVLSISIALTLSSLFHAGRYLKLERHQVTGLTSWQDFLHSISSKSSIALIPLLIISAILLGLIGSHFQQRGFRNTGVNQLFRFAEMGNRICIRILNQILFLVPVAVFGSVGRAVGLFGHSVLSGLFAYFLVTIGGMLIHIIFVYHSWVLLAGIRLKTFWQAAREPVLYSFGINSSLATLPQTLIGLDRLGVSRGASRLAACIGTNFNNDGILLYEVVAVFFMADAYGIQIPIVSQLMIVTLCIIAMIGVGGIPEAGVVSLSLVLTASGLPTDDIPILLGVDWLVARTRSVTNVVGDMSGSIAVDFFLKRIKSTISDL